MKFINTPLFWAGIILIIFTGCKQAGTLDGLVPCSGTVLYNGKPLADATVTFLPSEGSQPRNAFARTDSDGKFTLQTLKPQDGIAPGEYRVTVVKIKNSSSSGGGLADVMSGKKVKPETNPMKPKKTVYEIPEKYTKADTSGLTQSIPAKGNRNITLELKD